MPTPKLTREKCLEAVQAYKLFVDRGYPAHNPAGDNTSMGAKSAAADWLGIKRRTFSDRVDVAKKRFGMDIENVPAAVEIARDDGDPDPVEVLDRHSKANTEYISAKRKKPAAFIVPKRPFAVAFIGDPHLSNKGCNLDALRNDIAKIAASGVRAVQMGDVLDNFHATGKLAQKEAYNRMTIKEGHAVAEWLVVGSGIKWDAHVEGNHDAWMGADGIELFRSWVRAAKSRRFDWNARLIYAWGEKPDERHTIMASHDMKGHSQYNPTHGPGKMALWDGTADTYVAAHRHNHAEAKVPNGFRGRTYQLVRVRGYKDVDEYSEGRPQFAPLDSMEGRSALLVVNPLSSSHDGRQRVFMDIADGLEHLQMLRSHYEKSDD